MGEAEVAALLASGDLENVEADPVTAGREIAAARRHVESASRLAEDDPSAGFAIGYDAVRKAIAAHMRARGLRARGTGGHHRRIGRYAVAALDGEGIAMHVEAFDQLRRLDADVKGDAYEGLLEKNAEDVKSGAGQYFTPRPLIDAIVAVMRPAPGQRICDPAAGTGGFLLAAHRWIVERNEYLDPDEKAHLRFDALRGWEIVDNTARLCVMNLLLHGIGDETADSPIAVEDALSGTGRRFDMVLTNPPFGRKSSISIVNAQGQSEREAIEILRDDLWASTSNTQLNFVQHVATLLEIDGRAAVVVPDNVLFEGGAGGETVRRKLLQTCDVHTLLRLPIGIFYGFGYDDLLARDKVSLDLTWLRDESLEDVENLPPPDAIAREIVEDLEAALAEFAAVAQSLAPDPPPSPG